MEVTFYCNCYCTLQETQYVNDFTHFHKFTRLFESWKKQPKDWEHKPPELWCLILPFQSFSLQCELQVIWFNCSVNLLNSIIFGNFLNGIGVQYGAVDLHSHVDDYFFMHDKYGKIIIMLNLLFLWYVYTTIENVQSYSVPVVVCCRNIKCIFNNHIQVWYMYNHSFYAFEIIFKLFVGCRILIYWYIYN